MRQALYTQKMRKAPASYLNLDDAVERTAIEYYNIFVLRQYQAEHGEELLTTHYPLATNQKSP